MRLRYTSKGWFYVTKMRTGAYHLPTNTHIPEIQFGKVLPEWLELRVGPYPTAIDAAKGLAA